MKDCRRRKTIKFSNQLHQIETSLFQGDVCPSKLQKIRGHLEASLELDDLYKGNEAFYASSFVSRIGVWLNGHTLDSQESINLVAELSIKLLRLRLYHPGIRGFMDSHQDQKRSVA